MKRTFLFYVNAALFSSRVASTFSAAQEKSGITALQRILMSNCKNIDNLSPIWEEMQLRRWEFRFSRHWRQLADVSGTSSVFIFTVKAHFGLVLPSSIHVLLAVRF
jgi:hypothetical protein